MKTLVLIPQLRGDSHQLKELTKSLRPEPQVAYSGGVLLSRGDLNHTEECFLFMITAVITIELQDSTQTTMSCFLYDNDDDDDDDDSVLLSPTQLITNTTAP